MVSNWELLMMSVKGLGPKKFTRVRSGDFFAQVGSGQPPLNLENSPSQKAQMFQYGHGIRMGIRGSGVQTFDPGLPLK